ncbi:MAG TPA: helix-turn-helix transcriptional regulator [Solirubrobacteraceae bacterium]|nr:helix-turn-helix transcriptional regulator [Solirubrobacteraceae bacterium]
MGERHWRPTAENARAIRECVAQNLRRERLRAGLSQAALAETSGVGRDTIARLEAARREPRLVTLVPLAFALNVSIHVLLAGLPRPDA